MNVKQITGFFDSDTHVYEPISVWTDYLDPKLRDRSPQWINADDGRLRVEVGGVIFPSMPNHPGLGSTYGPTSKVDRTGNDPAVRLKRMDAEGALAHVVFPTLGLTGFPGMVADPELAGGFARAYNRYMSEYCAASPERLRGAMLLPFNHPEVAAAEARWAHEHGLQLAVSNPTPPADRAWSDPFYDPIWRTLDELEIPLALHEITTGCPPHTIGVQRYAPTYQMIYLVTHTIEPALGLCDLIVSGTLQRFPGLKVMLAEAHVAWLPGMLQLLDYTYETVGGGSPFVKSIASRRDELQLDLKPSDYFRRQCTVSAFPDDPGLDEVAALYPENLMISTDWPHPVGEGRRGVQELAVDGGLSDDLKQALLVDNATRFFSNGPSAS